MESITGVGEEMWNEGRIKGGGENKRRGRERRDTLSHRLKCMYIHVNEDFCSSTQIISEPPPVETVAQNYNYVVYTCVWLINSSD